MNRHRPLFSLHRVTALGAALLCGRAGAAITPESPSCIGGICAGMPRDVSADGYRIDSLMNWTHLFNIILFVIMCGWIAWACIKHNRHHLAEYDHGSSKHSLITALVISAVIFLVVDGNLFWNTMKGLDEAFWNFDIPRTNANTVKLEINAHQWAWDARYAGADGKFNTDDDIVTWNDIKVPVGTPIYVQLSSTDVLHSFYLPNFRVKMDAVPGQINRMWFQATTAGEYEIGCAQHCGTHHYKMRAQLTVLSPEDFKRWEQNASATALRGFDPADNTAHWAWEWKEF